MEQTRRLVAVLVAGLLVSATGGLWLRQGETASATDDPRLGVAEALATTTTTEPPTTTTTAAPVPVAAKAPRPVDVPANPYAREPLVELGTIEIPKIGLNHRIFHGISLRTIDRGPSHWPGTAMPGEVGNSVFAGHRVTHSRPFRNIDQLVQGDEVVFNVNGARSVYTVTGHEVVTPKALRIVQPTATPTATLFACHPPGSAKYRYVVYLALKSTG